VKPRKKVEKFFLSSFTLVYQQVTTFKKKDDENNFLSFTSVFQQVTVKSVKVEFEFFHPEKLSTRNSRNTKK